MRQDIELVPAAPEVLAEANRGPAEEPPPAAQRHFDRVRAKVAGTVRGREALQPGLWYDTGAAEGGPGAALVARILETGYTGLLIDPSEVDTYCGDRFRRLDKVVQVETPEDWSALLASHPQLSAQGATTVASASAEVLASARHAGLRTCLRTIVEDGPSLARAIAAAGSCDHVLVRFRDPTNIPLELMIAEFQSTRTAVLKEIVNFESTDDLSATLGTLETGVDGLVYSPPSTAQIDTALPLIRRACSPSLRLEPAVVEQSVQIGMGHRACIDLVTMFEPDEGLLIGSTSQGGILCCPEVFDLPYMERRPFRVNAGGVHAYLFGPNDRTNYLTELRGGMSCLVVGAGGRTRIAPLGRTKIEVRPLRLIACRFEGGEQIGIVLQDDWHVRLFGADGAARNITDLRPGDRLLAHRARPGRHVGIAVDEFIEEN